MTEKKITFVLNMFQDRGIKLSHIAHLLVNRLFLQKINNIAIPSSS